MSNSLGTNTVVIERPTPKWSYRKWLWPLPLLLIATVGFLYGNIQVAARNRPIPLLVDEARLDIGRNWSQKGFEWVLPITNTGNTDIEIVDVTAACTCTSIAPRALVVRAGDSATVRLTIDLTPSQLRADDKSLEWPFEVSLRAAVKTDSLRQPDPWIIRGRVQNALFTNPKEVQFDGADRVFRGSVPVAKPLSVTALRALRDIRAEIVPPIAEVSLSPLEDEKTFQVVVTPRSDLPPGPFEAKLRLYAELSTGERPPPLIVPIIGQVCPDVYAIPEVIQFAVVATGSRQTGIISLVSRRGAQFASEPAHDQPSGISIRRFSEEPQDEHKYRFEIAVAGVGSQTLKAHFLVTEGNEPPVNIVVQVVYYSLEGD